ncbi:MAG: ATP-binding protein [Kiritimatiellia bacterium]|jgi:signal transduction histidine kinase|nr:ATP-binding protein [Kiritimatiellia bacterium]MDP6630725.1 ATP-binding protein [Kiritimatiellia bacterium]MDP6809412.1 ATP-binding protein [Kiritimatiellia bacterium]MDP7023911.1 ATP-binding protein [Kiritimatiellia bacterium]
MSCLFQRWLSVDSRSLRSQFGIGLLLFFAIPALAMWYFTHAQDAGGSAGPAWIVLFTLFVLMLAVAGFLLMRRGPVQVETLRDRLENVVRAELTDRVSDGALSVANDVESINACMRVIVEELRSHINEVESERGRLNENLIQAEKIEGLGTMATGVAHDFNNLIAAVMGNASIVVSSMAADSPTRDNVLQIQASAAQAVELTNKIALYSGHCRFDGAPVKLSSLVEENREAIETLVFKGVKVEYRLDDDMPLICGDRHQLQQLLRALVQNASEAIVSRVGAVTVSTGMMLCDAETVSKLILHEKIPPGRYAYLEVADDGAGLTQQVRSRMCDPFYSSKIRGQGMGLSVVLGVSRAHSGGVLVESVVDHGSAFRVLFPCPSALNNRVS